MRGHRRSNLRYRAPRFLNRTKPTGWLAPSLQHRVDTTRAWVTRLCRWAPVSVLSCELVRFDLQQMDNSEIAGVEYQQGTLYGYEVREYLLEKWARKCCYCDKTDVPLQLEHLLCKARGGSNRVSNLGLACGPCNQAKGSQPLREFLADDPKRLAAIQGKAKHPLRDAAAVNNTRWALVSSLKTTGLAVETASGGRTKFNRRTLSVPKTHALDAACVGKVSALTGWSRPVVTIKCNGRGSYQRTRLDAYGFSRGYLTREKSVKGFQTGDRVVATVPTGKKTGIHVGRVAIRRTGSFNIQTSAGVVQGVSYRHCRLVQRGDGYDYGWLPAVRPLDPKEHRLPPAANGPRPRSPEGYPATKS